ncbi:neutral amino acid transporter A [Striga asiatica]|uniref:Neutral amino acid transporter A n=1 Tax=Striga asiatica TaxID=4170 RepID=A0A5A7Q429_STRAF|nr:neutral amino acid transporter A [Striga asiatica]
MKASIKFRDEQKPLLRAKVPLNVLNLPFQAGVVAGDSKELSLNLGTFLDSGPSLRFSYRPNDSKNPFGFVFKTGVGKFGSPANSPVTMSAEFNLVGGRNPSFFIHFKPNVGDFSLKKSHSSDLVRCLGEKPNGGGGDEGFARFLPATAESKAAAGMVVGGLLKGAEVGARTRMPLRDLAVVNFRWGLRVPPAAADEMDAVVVGRKGGSEWPGGGVRMPLLVMNKIGIEHVARSKESKAGPEKLLAEACLDVKKQLEGIQAENGLLGKALSELRSDMAAGKMEFLPESRRGRYSGGGADRRVTGDKKSLEVKGFGGEDGSKGL